MDGSDPRGVSGSEAKRSRSAVRQGDGPPSMFVVSFKEESAVMGSPEDMSVGGRGEKEVVDSRVPGCRAVSPKNRPDILLEI
eukprot:SAG31_NODE_1274_length_9050_cov_10.910178_6_plen_82_part_00